MTRSDAAARLLCAIRKRAGSRSNPRVIADFRAPDLLRFAPVAHYNSAEDVDQAIAALREIIDRREYLEISDTKELVT
jgi:selenocysteine lyase/cysteine desulfurase